jgi:pimeloyl-ACP methyl ester carboxylesterase
MLFNNLQHYIVGGSGPPIVFIHGFGLDHRMWEHQMKFFSSAYTVISIDLRGFGKSAPPSEKAFAYHEDIAELLFFLGINQPVVLVGQSMGARAVANFALTWPEKTRAVVFVDGAIEGYTFKNFDLSDIYQTAKSQGAGTANKMWLDHPIFDSARKNPVISQKLNKMVMEYSGWHYIHKSSFKNLATPAYDQLENIKSPALIITGQYDLPDFQIIAQALHKKIPGSVKMEIAGAGHMCNMESPEVFNNLVSEFLNSV